MNHLASKITLKPVYSEEKIRLLQALVHVGEEHREIIKQMKQLFAKSGNLTSDEAKDVNNLINEMEDLTATTILRARGIL